MAAPRRPSLPATPESFRRSFTAPIPKLSPSPRPSHVDPSDAAAEILYSHPSTKTYSFSPPGVDPRTTKPASLDLDFPVDAVETLPWTAPRETLEARGLLLIEKVQGSTAFLKSGKLLHAILRNSQCWCVDGDSKFVLRRGAFRYYRIELPNVTEEDRQKIVELKLAFAKVLRFEVTPCPFKRDFKVELPADVSTPKKKKAWRPRHSVGASSPLNMSSYEDWRESRRPSTAMSFRSVTTDGDSNDESRSASRADSYSTDHDTPEEDLQDTREDSTEAKPDAPETQLESVSSGHLKQAFPEGQPDIGPLDDFAEKMATESASPAFEAISRVPVEAEKMVGDPARSQAILDNQSKDDVVPVFVKDAKRQSTSPSSPGSSADAKHLIVFDEGISAPSSPLGSDNIKSYDGKDSIMAPRNVDETLSTDFNHSGSTQSNISAAIQEDSASLDSDAGVGLVRADGVGTATLDTDGNSRKDDRETNLEELRTHVEDSTQIQAVDMQEDSGAPRQPLADHNDRDRAFSASEVTKLDEVRMEHINGTQLEDDRLNLRHEYSEPALPVTTVCESDSSRMLRDEHVSTENSQRDGISSSASTESFQSLASFYTSAPTLPPSPPSDKPSSPDQPAAFEHPEQYHEHTISHRREVSEVTVTEAKTEEDNVLERCEHPSTPKLIHDSASDGDWPDVVTPVAAEAVRQRRTVKRSGFSPLPPASTLLTSSPRRQDSHLTTAIVQKAVTIAIGKPLEAVIMLFHVFSRIAAGATVQDLLSGELFRRPDRQPAQPTHHRRSESVNEDDYGMPIRGRPRNRSTPGVDDGDGWLDLD